MNTTQTHLFYKASSKFFIGLLLVGLLLFIPAGTFKFWNAWLLIGILFTPMLCLGVILLFKSPELLKKRLNSKEKELKQKNIILLSLILFIIGFIIAGLDFRFSWSSIPIWGITIACIILFFSYLLYAEVMRENQYLSRTIEVQKNQRVVDTGLYSVIRHPMYLATILLFLSIPIVLGSIYSFIFFLLYLILIIMRINNEEIILEKELNGYLIYKKKVKYKLIPFIW